MRTKPKIVFVVDHKGWCGEGLSASLARRLPEFDCSVVRLGDKEHLSFDADLYVYRNICWMTAFPLPPHILRRTVSLVESSRVFVEKYRNLFPLVLGVIPLTKEFAEGVKEYKPKRISEPIENGIETEQFIPAKKVPKEFVVGAAGNFSLPVYDDWKGFTKYIVPACKKAKVELKWCGWHGTSATGEQAPQIPLEEMPEFYKQLSCFILMSKSEGCSGVIFEAMAAGLPVITTPVGWHRENCKDEIIWIERPAEETPEAIEATIDKIASKLSWLKKNKGARKRLGLRAREFAEKYSWDVVIPKWRKVLNDYLVIAGEEQGKADKLRIEQAGLEQAAADKLKAEQAKAAADKLKAEQAKVAADKLKAEQAKAAPTQISIKRPADQQQIINITINIT